MATCPSCGANSRTDDGFTVDNVLEAKPLGTFSLAGNQPKVSAVSRLRMAHTCGWSVTGHIEDDDFVVDRDQEPETHDPAIHSGPREVD